MHIVTDSGVDLSLTPTEQRDLRIHVVPLVITLEGKTYREGVDIAADDFYERLEEAKALPTTSQPSPGTSPLSTASWQPSIHRSFRSTSRPDLAAP